MQSHQEKKSDTISILAKHYIECETDSLEEHLLNQFKHALKDADINSLSSLSPKGRSHLLTIFHLSYKAQTSDPQKIGLRTRNLFYALMLHCTDLNLPRLKSFFLLKPDNYGLRPFHYALKLMDTLSLKAYFSELYYANAMGILTMDKYIGADKAIPSPLYYALHAKNPKNITAYCAEIRDAIHQKILTKEEYASLLIGTPDKDKTLLICLLTTIKKPDNLKAYLDEINLAIDKGFLTNDQYIQLLTQADKDGYTPLHYAAFNAIFTLVELLVSELNKVLDARQLLNCLTASGGRLKNITPSCHVADHHPEALTINAYLQEKIKECSQKLSQQKKNSKDEWHTYTNECHIKPKKEARESKSSSNDRGSLKNSLFTALLKPSQAAIDPSVDPSGNRGFFTKKKELS